jgi:glycosyltransferase involved in cell wall biosynthesis
VSQAISMRIAYLCHSPIPSNVASSIQVMKMCQALARDHDLTLFCPPATGQAQTGKVYEFYGVESTFKIRRLPQLGSWADRTLEGARLLRWELALRRFDLVYARCNAWRPYRVHRIKLPLLVEAHLLHRAPQTARLLGCPWVRGLVVVSDSLRRDYSRTYGLNSADVLTAHNGADPARPSRPAALPGSSPVRCGYVGNLYEGKGVEIIIPLARRCSQIDFHIFGGTADQVTAVAGDDRRAAHTESLVPWLVAAGGHRRCAAFLRHVDRPLPGGRPGSLEGPLKIFEYMAAGKAIIASDLPALREMLRDGENAALVPPDDVQAWVRAIHDLATDATERQRLGARAHESFVEQHSWQARARRIMDAFAPTEAKTESLGPSAQHIKVDQANQ